MYLIHFCAWISWRTVGLKLRRNRTQRTDRADFAKTRILQDFFPLRLKCGAAGPLFGDFVDREVGLMGSAGRRFALNPRLHFDFPYSNWRVLFRAALPRGPHRRAPCGFLDLSLPENMPASTGHRARPATLGTRTVPWEDMTPPSCRFAVWRQKVAGLSGELLMRKPLVISVDSAAKWWSC